MFKIKPFPLPSVFITQPNQLYYMKTNYLYCYLLSLFVGKKVNDAAKEVTDFLNDAVGKNWVSTVHILQDGCMKMMSYPFEYILLLWNFRLNVLFFIAAHIQKRAIQLLTRITILELLEIEIEMEILELLNVLCYIPISHFQVNAGLHPFKCQTNKNIKNN